MLRPSPAAAGLAFLLAGCGPNDLILSAFQYGGNLANTAMNSLHDATDDDQPIDPEAMRAHSRQVCVEQKLSEADCALEQATNPANIVTGIAKGALGHAGARGYAGAAASQ
ncbi:MAG: hypothetical protein AB7I59_01795 [Geminicoccaceae bacterium]